jgi:hypothetical protein
LHSYNRTDRGLPGSGLLPRPAYTSLPMATHRVTDTATFRVLDAMGAPHGGRILRLRLDSGEAPSIGALKGARWRAKSPDGTTEVEIRINGFAVFGGRPSDKRLARTGRVDVHVSQDAGAVPVSARWEVSGPLA